MEMDLDAQISLQITAAAELIFIVVKQFIEQEGLLQPGRQQGPSVSPSASRHLSYSRRVFRRQSLWPLTGDIENAPMDAREIFGFDAKDIKTLRTLFGIPPTVQLGHSRAISGDWAMCALLSFYRGEPLRNLAANFAMGRGEISRIIGYVRGFVDRKRKIIDLFSHPYRDELITQRIASFVNAISVKTDIPINISSYFAFIDGTSCRICRPGDKDAQMVCYDGMDRMHCVTLLAANLPDGLIHWVGAPDPGRHNDKYLQTHSNYQDYHVFYKENVGAPGEREYFLTHQTNHHISSCILDNQVWKHVDVLTYADKGLHRTRRISIPFNDSDIIFRSHLPLAEYNSRMRSARISIEWSFAYVKKLFPLMKTQSKIFETDVAANIRCCFILANCHTCLYGNEIGNYFGLRPPTLQQLFNGLNND